MKTIDIVFVHLNSPIPLFLRLNLRSVVRDFPNSNVVLIHDQDDPPLLPRGVSGFRYSWSDNLGEINRNLMHPKEFRNNFWLTSIGRFDAIRAFIAVSNRPLIHIESDVVISRDFPFNAFQNLSQGLAFPVVASNRGVASNLYVSNLASAKKLVNQSIVTSKENPNTSDMEILAILASNPSEDCFSLPFSATSDDFLHISLGEEKTKKTEKAIQYFGGLFDGNDIGVFLFGSDPRNRRGISYIGQEIKGNFASVSNWEFVYEKNRKFLSVVDRDRKIPIFSSHVTSKSLFIFWHKTRPIAIKLAVVRRPRKPKVRFHILTFIQMSSKKALQLLFDK